MSYPRTRGGYKAGFRGGRGRGGFRGGRFTPGFRGRNRGGRGGHQTFVGEYTGNAEVGVRSETSGQGRRGRGFGKYRSKFDTVEPHQEQTNNTTNNL